MAYPCQCRRGTTAADRVRGQTRRTDRASTKQQSSSAETAMNCDQAFDNLTDPARRSSPELSRHLASCARCRQMHETLAPALALFDHGLAEEPDLIAVRSGYSAPAGESVLLAEQAATRLATR